MRGIIGKIIWLFQRLTHSVNESLLEKFDIFTNL